MFFKSSYFHVPFYIYTEEDVAFLFNERAVFDVVLVEEVDRADRHK